MTRTPCYGGGGGYWTGHNIFHPCLSINVVSPNSGNQTSPTICNTVGHLQAALLTSGTLPKVSILQWFQHGVFVGSI